MSLKIKVNPLLKCTNDPTHLQGIVKITLHKVILNFHRRMARVFRESRNRLASPVYNSTAYSGIEWQIA